MSCNITRTNLVECVLKTDCVLRKGKTAQECLKEPDLLPEECQHLRKAFFECKRGMLDMRKRFRGIDKGQPAKVSKVDREDD